MGKEGMGREERFCSGRVKNLSSLSVCLLRTA